MNLTAQDPLKKIGIYFYVPEKNISEEVEHYTLMEIVDGLTELGYPCYSNAPHPKLIQEAVTEAYKRIVVLEVTAGNYSPVLMKAFAEFKARAKLIHSRSDDTPCMFTPEGITCLMAHESRFSVFRQKRVPMGFGLSRSRLAHHENNTPFSKRRPVILRNFRSAAQQSVRESLDLALLPTLEKYFEIDRTLDVASYPERLATSTGCLAYCGLYTSDLMKNGFFHRFPQVVQLDKNRTMTRDPVVLRWDSWRFWESLASGCLTFQLNFDEYGFALPVMPVPWKHYIPLDLTDLKGSVEQLMDRKVEWESIAASGKAWAVENYTPVPVARRFLEACREELRLAPAATAVAA
jgi:hypothetical protein